MIRPLALLALALPLLASTALADVRLPAVFSDHMVLQRGKPLRFWGWADSGERVTVKLAGRREPTEADEDGRWSLELPPMKAGGPYVLTVKTRGNTIRIKDVLIGEVWVCSGQSNMEWPVSGASDSKREIAKADDSKIRHFKIPHRPAGKALDDVEAQWQVCSPKTAKRFTACGYFMARALRKKLRVPIGLINTSWGGTRIEPWIAPIGFSSVASLADIEKQVEANAGNKPANHQQPAVLYRGMVHAIVGYPMRGVIWYQGESNLGETDSYTAKMKALIGGWRTLWKSGEFPFHYVQIAPYHYGQSPDTVLPAFWEAQSAVLNDVPGTGMVVTNDIATLDNIHPPNKQDVGKRLALLALNRVYDKDVVDSGPTFSAMTIEDGKIRVTFDHADGGLKSRDREPLTHFEIAGATGGFVPAEATIDGTSIVLSSKDVAEPLVMRFAWHKLAQPNLVNGAGLPTSAFRAGELPKPDSLAEIDEASAYTLVYDLDLARLGPTPVYDVNESATTTPAFDRVAYLLELVAGDGTVQYVWTSMDAFTTDAKLLGVPTAASGASFQMPVQNLTFKSNVELPVTAESVEGHTKGHVEFWPGNYGPDNAAGVAGASAEVYDWGDTASAPTAGYGSMQVHVPSAGVTLFAVNHWTAGGSADIGIGNSTIDPRATDWTFARNAGSYLHKRLRVFVRMP